MVHPQGEKGAVCAVVKVRRLQGNDHESHASNRHGDSGRLDVLTKRIGHAKPRNAVRSGKGCKHDCHYAH